MGLDRHRYRHRSVVDCHLRFLPGICDLRYEHLPNEKINIQQALSAPDRLYGLSGVFLSGLFPVKVECKFREPLKIQSSPKCKARKRGKQASRVADARKSGFLEVPVIEAPFTNIDAVD